MNLVSHWRRSVPLVGVLAALSLGLTACGGNSNAGSTGTGATGQGTVAPATKVDSLAKLVPSSVIKNGTITVATDPSYAPNEFFAKDNKTITGMDVDLGKAIGQVLGVKLAFTKAGFDGIIPGMASGKYPMSMSSFTDTKLREKTVNFVTYFSAGTAMMVKSGNPDKLSPDGNSLCGKTVAVEKGTTQAQDDIPARSKKCTQAGKSAIKPGVYPDQSTANLALSSGRADAVLADSPVAEYAAKQSNGQFEISGSAYGTAPYGIAVAKQSGTLDKAILGALKQLISNGTYKEVLTKWGVADGAITDPVINGATS